MRDRDCDDTFVDLQNAEQLLDKLAHSGDLLEQTKAAFLSIGKPIPEVILLAANYLDAAYAEAEEEVERLAKEAYKSQE